MKNIYVLPTNKPSRLFLNKVNNKLLLQHISNPSLKKVLPSRCYQNIYITADLEIKEGEWFITTGGYLHRCHTKNSKTIYYVTNSGGIAIGAEYCKKVILTTDLDLIKDGVQAIDNTFAEWLVKNSNCERVEIDSTCKCVTCNSSVKSSCDYVYKCRPQIFYKIIIPQEEPNDEYKYIGECNGNNGNGCFLDSPGHNCGCFVRVSEEDPKEKTIEEIAFEKYPRSMSEKDSELRNEFINGAKLVEERMFTKKDMIDFAIWVYLEVNQISGKERTNEELFIEWCNKFKKK